MEFSVNEDQNTVAEENFPQYYENEFKCKDCDYTTIHQRNLKAHIDSIHSLQMWPVQSRVHRRVESHQTQGVNTLWHQVQVWHVW